MARFCIMTWCSNVQAVETAPLLGAAEKYQGRVRIEAVTYICVNIGVALNRA
ncbi:hypothetical protein E2542_SST01372 [Spatholobus suberectus]|nr:hypothetical protein E2542_SST01372 [Spatholobus suberectus]